jgi:hypothetical protein
MHGYTFFDKAKVISLFKAKKSAKCIDDQILWYLYKRITIYFCPYFYDIL